MTNFKYDGKKWTDALKAFPMYELRQSSDLTEDDFDIIIAKLSAVLPSDNAKDFSKITASDADREAVADKIMEASVEKALQTVRANLDKKWREVIGIIPKPIALADVTVTVQGVDFIVLKTDKELLIRAMIPGVTKDSWLIEPGFKVLNITYSKVSLHTMFPKPSSSLQLAIDDLYLYNVNDAAAIYNNGGVLSIYIPARKNEDFISRINVVTE